MHDNCVEYCKVYTVHKVLLIIVLFSIWKGEHIINWLFNENYFYLVSLMFKNGLQL